MPEHTSKTIDTDKLGQLARDLSQAHADYDAADSAYRLWHKLTPGERAFIADVIVDVVELESVIDDFNDAWMMLADQRDVTGDAADTLGDAMKTLGA